MIPGEYDIQPGDIELNAGRRTLALSVANTGDRPIRSARTTTSSRSTTPSPSTVRPPVACA